MSILIRRRTFGAAAAAVLAAPGVALGQPQSDKAMRWVVPYPAGGITDAVTRLVSTKLGAALGRTVVVDNKPGANSIIGAETVARAAPDGSTLLTVIAGHAANATLYAGKLSFDPVQSFVPVSLMGIAPLVLTANKDFAPNDVRELIAYAKANPGRVAFGSSGIGAAAHLTSEMINQMTGTDMIHVPYKGSAPAVQDLMSGQIQILIDSPSSMMPHVRAGKIKALAMLSRERLPAAAEVPTVTEAGGPPLESATWMMALAPAGTSDEVAKRLSQEISRIVLETDVKDRFVEMAIIPAGWTPERTRAFLSDEVARWASVIKQAGVKLEL